MRPLALFLLALSLTSCVTVGRLESASGMVDPAAAQVSGFPANVRVVNPDHETFLRILNETIIKSRPGARDGTLDVLALSGGGAGGGFGAGVIVGMTEAGRRPVFEVVTGVSTGALIAPFAFLGSDWDDELERAYTGGRSEDIARTAGLSSLFRLGVLDASELRRLVSEFVTPELIEAVARESAGGRTLLVATTNLDAEIPVLWDMGVIARKGGPEAQKLFTDVLVASASIPGAFAPVIFRVDGEDGPHDELHVDGGVTVPFFIFPDVAFLSDDRFSVLRGANIYVVINGQLDPFARTAEANAVTIAIRALNVTLTRMARTELLLTSTFSRIHGMTMRFTYIPRRYPFSGSFDFDAGRMRSLFDYARTCATTRKVWLTEADVRKHIAAPFIPPTGAAGCPVP
jgi:predicted acylesterase/phospholipase RssA